MGWSPENAVNAYLDTIKLCKLDDEKKYTSTLRNTEPQSTEFISALAAGMNAQLIVEVCSGAAASTIGLAAAARQTGGRLVCILPKADTLAESMKAIKELGLEDSMEFVIGDANELLPQYKSVDFSLIDCKTEGYAGLFNLLNVNPSLAVVVANNLFYRKATAAYARTFKRKPGAKSITLPIGKGIEVTRITRLDQFEIPPNMAASTTAKPRNKSRWIVHIDEHTGEEHVFRMSRNTRSNVCKIQGGSF